MSNKILVIGGDHHNTLGIIESLANKGIKPFVIIYGQLKHSYIQKSKFIADFWIATEEEQVLDIMNSHCKSLQGKTAVLSGSDDVSCLLDRHYDNLKSDFVLPLCKKQGDLNKWINKENMSDLATIIGMNVPQRWVVNNGVIPDDIIYPCITKAISSIEGTKLNISICNNRSELESFFADKQHCSCIAIQKFIDKKFEFQFLGCSFNNGEDVLITGRTQIDRPNGIDNTFFLKFDNVEEEFNGLIEQCKEFIKVTGYQGTFSIEFLKGKDGVNYFTEMNFRNDGNAICQTAAGINVPYIWYLYGNKLDYKKVIEDAIIKPVYLLPETQQVKFWLQGEISLRELFKDIKLTNVCTTLFKKDIKPFFWFFIYKFMDKLL